MTKQYWHVRECSLFRELTTEQLLRIERTARQKKFGRGSAIYLPMDEADEVFILAEGRIRIGSATPDGKQVTLAFVEPGEVFGELGLIDSGKREERAEALVDSIVVQLSGQGLRELMESSASLTLGVTKLIGFRRQRIERRLKSLLFRSNSDRLAHLLIDLSEQYGKAISNGILLNIKLSHQDLASIIGSTRETITSLLGQMQENGLISMGRQRIVICDIQSLSIGAGLDFAPSINQECHDLRRSNPVLQPKITAGLSDL